MSQHANEYWPADLVAGVAVNCRPGDEDVSDLVASIAAHGLLQPLVGRLVANGRVEIIDGNRRLKAIKHLWIERRWTEAVPVMLRDHEPDADAFEISVAANVLRKPLHPVAEYEAFAQLAERGKTNDDIAAHFGITLRQVEQRQALGRLHPDVRKAWLEGVINGESARAFTLVPADEQALYLQKAMESQEGWRLRADSVRRSFTTGTVPADHLAARFIGAEAYRVAGGRFVADLFVEQPDFADGDLLQRLVDDKLAAEAARIQQEEGWGEVLFGSPAQQSYMWGRLTKPALPEAEKPARAVEIEQRLAAIAERRQEIEDALDRLEWDEDDEPAEVATQLREDDDLASEQTLLDREKSLLTEQSSWLRLPEAQRAKAIATIGIERDGSLTIARGFTKTKPKAEPKPSGMVAPKPKPAADGEEAPEPARLSAALMDDLALTATRAAAHVLAGEPRIALAAFVATAVCYGTPLRIDLKGRGEGPDLPWPARSYEHRNLSFGDVFRSAIAWDQEALQKQVARAIAHALDFTSTANNANSYDSLQAAAVTDLRCALPVEAHRAALVQAFDPAAYFTAAPKAEAIAAIAECGDEPSKHTKLKKGDLIAVTARLATAHRWLPPLLRGEVFTAIDTPPEPEDTPEPETPAEALPLVEQHQSAAEAAQGIWQDQERKRLEELKTADLRKELKARGVTAPFGSTHAAMVLLALAPRADEAEAA